MTSTTTISRPRGSNRLSLEWIAPAILVLAALLLIVGLSRSTPGRETIRIQNRSGAPVTVNTSSSDSGSWLGLGTFDPNSREEIQAVVDQGDTWVFRLTVGPDQIGEIRRTTDQLRDADWTVTIPADAVNQLPLERRSRL